MKDDFDYKQLDPGIRETVRWMHDLGYETTDSGDGQSKADLIASGDALPYPHVVMRTTPVRLVADADKLYEQLHEIGVEIREQGPEVTPCIQAIYDPATGHAAIMLMGVNDRAMGQEAPAFLPEVA